MEFIPDLTIIFREVRAMNIYYALYPNADTYDRIYTKNEPGSRWPDCLELTMYEADSSLTGYPRPGL
jgi:hypothetical protein